MPQLRLVTDGTGNWQKFKLPGFLHSAVLDNVGGFNLHIIFGSVPDDINYKTLIPGQELIIDALDSSISNYLKINTEILWYRDTGTATTWEMVYTCKGRAD